MADLRLFKKDNMRNVRLSRIDMTITSQKERANLRNTVTHAGRTLAHSIVCVHYPQFASCTHRNDGNAYRKPERLRRDHLGDAGADGEVLN